MKDLVSKKVMDNPELNGKFSNYMLFQPVNIDFSYIKNGINKRRTIHASVEGFNRLICCREELLEYEEYCEVDPDPCTDLEAEIEDILAHFEIPFYIEVKFKGELKKRNILYYNYHKKTVSYYLNITETYYLSGNLNKQVRNWLENLGFVVMRFLRYELEKRFIAIGRKKIKQAIAKANELKKLKP